MDSTNRRSFLKGILATTTSVAALAALPPTEAATPPEVATPLDLDAKRCPECNSPMAECLEPDVWTCLFCNNDKWYRYITVSGRNVNAYEQNPGTPYARTVPAGPAMDNHNPEAGPFRAAEPNAQINARKWRKRRDG